MSIADRIPISPAVRKHFARSPHVASVNCRAAYPAPIAPTNKRPLANRELEHDRERDADEEVHALAVERLAEVEDVADRDLSGDEGEGFQHSPRPARRLRRRGLPALVC